MAYLDRVRTYDNKTEVKLSLYEYDSFRQKEAALNVLLNVLETVAELRTEEDGIMFVDYNGKLDFAFRTLCPVFYDDLMNELLAKRKALIEKVKKDGELAK